MMKKFENKGNKDKVIMPHTKSLWRLPHPWPLWWMPHPWEGVSKAPLSSQ